MPEPNSNSMQAERISAELVETIRWHINRLRHDQERRDAVRSLIALGAVKENQLCLSLWELDIDSRLAAYEMLGLVGRGDSLTELERRFVETSQHEQYWLREAIQRIRSRHRSHSNNGNHRFDGQQMN